MLPSFPIKNEFFKELDSLLVVIIVKKIIVKMRKNE